VYQIFYRYSLSVVIVMHLLLLTQKGIAQGKIDSLKLLLDGRSGSQRFDILFSLSREYTTVNWDEALNFANQANVLAYEIGDSLRIVKSSRIKGQILRRLDRLDEAIRTFEIAYAISRRNKNVSGDFHSELKYALNGLAIAHTFLANYDRALDFHFQSLVIREREGDKSEISIALNNIGFVYFQLKNYDRALNYYDRSLQLKIESNDNYDLDRLYINIGLCYIELRNFDEALKAFDRGFKVCGDNCAEDIKIEGECSLGIAYYGVKNYDKAEAHFLNSLALSKSSNNQRFHAENLLWLARVRIQGNSLDKAKAYLAEAEQLADSAKYNQLLINSYKEFSNLYTLLEDYRRASFYQNKYIALKDSLIGEDLVKNIAAIQTNFEERVNIATIADNKEALRRQRNLNIAIGIIAMLAALLGFVLYRSNVVTKKVNSDLSEAKAVIENQNSRLQNINRELDARVKEKTAELSKANDELDRANKSLSQVNDELDNFIYKTSHDIRGPLASLKGICSVALMDVKDPLALDYLTKLDISSGRLNVILTRLLIVNQINNAIVGKEAIDFNGIVEDVILLEQKKGLPPKFEIKKDIQPNIYLQSDKDLVRIILENLIDNAIKFYNDSERINPFVHIIIGMQTNNKEVVVQVIDNGIGIAEAKPDKIFQMFSRASERSGTGGIGLYLSKLATEKLGGQIQLRTSAEGYTEFYVSFPVRMPVA